MRPPAAARPLAPAAAPPSAAAPRPCRPACASGRPAGVPTPTRIKAASSLRGDEDGSSPSSSSSSRPPLPPSSALQQQQPSSSSRVPPAQTVRVRLSVHYRVHSRQMLCIGGSTIPFGWSFVSISKVPMAWSPGDVWCAELELPAGSAVEYKYVVLEEQDWTRQVSEDAEGVVTFTYRGEEDRGGGGGWAAEDGAGGDPPPPPPPPGLLGPAAIQRQMAIVAWAPGPNKVVRVPTVAELAAVPVGGVVDREPARPSAAAPPGGVGAPPPPPRSPGSVAPTSSSAYAFGRRADGGAEGPILPGGGAKRKGGEGGGGDAQPQPLDGTWEKLAVGPDGVARLERRDVWGGPPPPSPSSSGIVDTPTTPPRGYGLR